MAIKKIFLDIEENEKEILKSFAEFEGLNLNNFILKTLREKIENFNVQEYNYDNYGLDNVIIQLPEKDRRLMEKFAKCEGKTLSEYIRDLFYINFEKHKRGKAHS